MEENPLLGERQGGGATEELNLFPGEESMESVERAVPGLVVSTGNLGHDLFLLPPSAFRTNLSVSGVGPPREPGVLTQTLQNR